MKKFTLLAATAFSLAAATAAPAAAQEAGDIQIRGFATAILPDGEITDVNVDAIGLPATSQTSVTDSFAPTIAAEYFVSRNFSIETICCIVGADVEGAGALAGTDLIDGVAILPATVTAKFHLPTESGIKPYVGGGVAHFFIFDEGVGADAAALGATDVSLSDEFGFVLQAGIDIPINDNGLMLSLDAKRYFIDTTATFTAGNTVALQTEHSLDPWVIGAGLGVRF